MPKIQDCTPDFHKKFGSMVPNFAKSSKQPKGHLHFQKCNLINILHFVKCKITQHTLIHSSPTKQWTNSLSTDFSYDLWHLISSLNRPNSSCKALICLLTALISAASVRVVFFCSSSLI